MAVIPYPRLQLKLTPIPALQMRFLPAIGTNSDIAAKVNRSGDTMTGPLILVSNPSAALEATTKQYVDAAVISGAAAAVPIDHVVALADIASVPLDASLGTQFKLLATGNRTIQAPTNVPATGRSQKIIIIHEAVGGTRTLSLASAFHFGSDITALTPTTSGTTDYIGAIWNEAHSRWDVVSYIRGF